jgi:AcrR family transcriptional regulator
MARPSTITPEEIVQAARRLFLKQGIARTEMKQIAAACGISRTTLYRYYDSKESIAFGLVTETLEHWFRNGLSGRERLYLFN